MSAHPIPKPLTDAEKKAAQAIVKGHTWEGSAEVVLTVDHMTRDEAVTLASAVNQLMGPCIRQRYDREK